MPETLAPLAHVPALSVWICTLIGSHPKLQALAWCREYNIPAVYQPVTGWPEVLTARQ